MVKRNESLYRTDGNYWKHSSVIPLIKYSATPVEPQLFSEVKWPNENRHNRSKTSDFGNSSRIEKLVVFVKFCKKIFCESRVPRTISRYVAATTRTNHRRRRRPAGRRVRRPSDEASPSGRRLARHSSFFHNQFFDGTGAPPGRQAAGANSRRCSFNCSFSTSMLRYRVASTQSS